MSRYRTDAVARLRRVSLVAFVLAAAGSSVGVAAGAAAGAAADAAGGAACEPTQGMTFVCGPLNAEDLVQVPGSPWVLASGMSGEGFSGHVYLLDPQRRAFELLYPSASARQRWDRETFPDCPGELDVGHFSAHGLSILAVGEGLARLYMTSHGAREAVEIFEVDSRGEKPTLTWVGCVPMPEHDSINSVAALADGGFLTTRIMQEGPGGDAPVFAGEISGFLYEWHPGGALQRVAGTDMSGPNGIVVAADQQSVFVGSWGRGQVERFEPAASGGLERTGTVDTGFRVDNLRWTDAGTLLAVGHRLAQEQDCGSPLCFDSWAVAEIDPQTLTSTILLNRLPIPGFTGATVALQDAAGGLWLGTFHGDRLAYVAEEDR